MINKQIVQYFKTYLDKGYHENQLKSALLSQGYNNQDIEDSLHAMKILTKPLYSQKPIQQVNSKEQQTQNIIQEQTQNVVQPEQQQLINQQQIQEQSTINTKTINTKTTTYQSTQKQQPINQQQTSNPETIKNSNNTSNNNNKDKNNKIIIISILLIVLIGLIGSVFYIINSESNDNLNNNFSDVDSTNELVNQNNNEISEEQIKEKLNCGSCQYEINNECKDYNCCDDKDCNDNNESTSDSCSSPKTLLAKCEYNDVIIKLNDTELQDIIDNATSDTTTNIYTPQNCTTNKTCNDNNPATLDFCDLDKKLCTHKIIRDCNNDDGFCPVGCRLEDDNDCEEIPNGQCLDDSYCDDNNNATSDSCLKQFGETYGICDFSTIKNCEDNDNFCPVGCWNTDDNDCSPDNLCSEDNDCDDDNSTTSDSCGGEPRVCIHELINTCEDNDNFCPVSCDSDNDNDCIQENPIEDPDKDECEDDIFCYKDKMVETKDYVKCSQILRYWNDPQDYFISQCVYEIALSIENSGLCNEISNSGIQTQCNNHFSS